MIKILDSSMTWYSSEKSDKILIYMGRMHIIVQEDTLYKKIILHEHLTFLHSLGSQSMSFTANLRCLYKDTFQIITLSDPETVQCLLSRDRCSLFGGYIMSSPCDPMDCSTPAHLPCPSLSPGVCPNSCPLSWWCYLLAEKICLNSRVKIRFLSLSLLRRGRVMSGPTCGQVS